ncbi:tetratricopeptide repeat protein [Actinomadura decatromicini]|uniref:Sel1 repeat family protein n=1 Tax=Actinomadura decatromicini TaxID=2604572 RepID=A0A5D3FZG2_9ACTN|nr:hypothetical protein [Actinomadura decatromicini]TYK53409.1 hypothetical protein FXF68_06830 [Actinomadura decatromicini]
MNAARDAYIAGRDQYIINVGGQSEASSSAPLGRVIGELGEQDALALEVHQAFEPSTVSTSVQVPVLPVYLHRPEFDDRLRAAVAGAAHGSRLVVVVGDSSTGKTRACWEAIRAELPDWRVWHPLTPERPLALAEAVRAGRIAARTVIWLNEAQFYLQPASGEQVAAELQALLADPARGPVLVLGSMWPNFRRTLTRVPDDEADPDPHRAARTLLDRTDYVTAPPAFTAAQLTSLAATIATDPRLRAAAAQARGGRITQELAGAPELLRRYEQASPAARAVLWAAMDARRLGHSLYLPEPLLQEAAPGYLDDHEWDQIGGTAWFRAALDELTAQHVRLPGPLVQHRSRPGEPAAVPLYRLADYLEQHARTERARRCPPASFWTAAAHHVHTPDDLVVLADQAERRGRYRHAAHLYQQATDKGNPDAFARLAWLRENAGDDASTKRLARQALDAGNTDALVALARSREKALDWQGAEPLYRQAADAGNPEALVALAERRESAGDRAGAKRLYRQAADAGNTTALESLAWQRERAGDPQGAERLAYQAADAGNTDALVRLARRREKKGDRQGAELLAYQAADAGHFDVLARLAQRREKKGDRRGAERLYRHTADAGNTTALAHLALLRKKKGDLRGAERLYRQAADAGSTDALVALANLRYEAGDGKAGGRLYQQAAEAGNPHALTVLVWERENAGDHEDAERLARQAADAGYPFLLVSLANRWEWTGDRHGAERLLREGADAGEGYALTGLVRLREEAGDVTGADLLRRFGLTAAGETEQPWT